MEGQKRIDRHEQARILQVFHRRVLSADGNMLIRAAAPMAHTQRMGIRYYAYSFDSDMTEQALANPRSVIGSDPLADAWGLEPGFSEGVTDFQQSLPERHMLYLDKAWSQLQRLTAPSDPSDTPRSAYRMFEGSVTNVNGGWEWHPWVRALAPDDVALIAADLETITGRDIEAGLKNHLSLHSDADAERSYVTENFERARRYVRGLAEEGRGFAYLIG